MNEIDYTDLLNIRAISIKQTQLWEIMGYWDAVDRSYPTYEKFIHSIKKLESLNAIKIHNRDCCGIISNTLYKRMSLIESFQYFINPTDKFLSKILNRLASNKEAIGLTINEADYNSIIKQYLHFAHR